MFQAKITTFSLPNFKFGLKRSPRQRQHLVFMQRTWNKVNPKPTRHASQKQSHPQDTTGLRNRPHPTVRLIRQAADTAPEPLSRTEGTAQRTWEVHIQNHRKQNQQRIPAHWQMQGGAQLHRQAGVSAELPPEALPRPLHPGLRQDILENRAGWLLRSKPPADPGTERLGPPVAGNPRVHAAKASRPQGG